ncbi:MAG: hypothetical protein NZ770_01035, partial [Candidatus Poseidoniaceae archaeon]|nr:hypothetical protein [Candidatus Poseidoniaceae archaeon]
MPVNSDIVAANFALDSNSIFSNNNASEGFDLALVSSGQEISLGTFDNFSIWIPESAIVEVDFAGAIQNLIDNPMVPVSHTDAYGNDWVSFHFKATSPNASTGASVRVLDLNVLYDWEQTLGASHGMVRELSQGVALGTPSGGIVSVPIVVRAGSGGAIHLSELSVVTSAGYSSSLTITGNPVGLYPDGSIIEVISVHDVDGSTGTTLQDCRLILESETGSAELSYSDFGGFAEVSDPGDIISLQPSSSAEVAEGKQVSWRFTVNTNWDDATDVRVYAALTAVNGVEGLPAAIHLAPPGANAVENDAGITILEVQNSAREVQDLDDGRSNQVINLVGSVRLENLDVSPDPTSYFLSFQ